MQVTLEETWKVQFRYNYKSVEDILLFFQSFLTTVTSCFFQFIFPFTCLAEVAGTRGCHLYQLPNHSTLPFPAVVLNLNLKNQPGGTGSWLLLSHLMIESAFKMCFPYLLFSCFSTIASCTFHCTWILVYSNFPSSDSNPMVTNGIPGCTNISYLLALKRSIFQNAICFIDQPWHVQISEIWTIKYL